MGKKPCNCKTQKDVNKVLKTIDEINKTKTKRKIKKTNWLKYILFSIIKVLIYFIGTLLISILVFPYSLYLKNKTKFKNKNNVKK